MIPLLISSTWESHVCSLMQTLPCVLYNTCVITPMGSRKMPHQYLQYEGPLHNHQVIQWMSHLACPYQVVAGLSPFFPRQMSNPGDRCAMHVSSASYISGVYSCSRKHTMFTIWRNNNAILLKSTRHSLCKVLPHFHDSFVGHCQAKVMEFLYDAFWTVIYMQLQSHIEGKWRSSFTREW